MVSGSLRKLETDAGERVGTRTGNVFYDIAVNLSGGAHGERFIKGAQ